MRQTIAISMLGIALFCNTVSAQTAVERAHILRDFQGSVADYAQRHQGLGLLPEAITTATPAPGFFTLPVAMVFRQVIAQSLYAGEGGFAIGGVSSAHRATVMQPFPAAELSDFPRVLANALPLLPAPLEYRLLGHDLVIRDSNADLIVAVLRDALGTVTTQLLK